MARNTIAVKTLRGIRRSLDFCSGTLTTGGNAITSSWSNQAFGQALPSRSQAPAVRGRASGVRYHEPGVSRGGIRSHNPLAFGVWVKTLQCCHSDRPVVGEESRSALYRMI